MVELWIVALIVIAVGLAGTVIPGLPGMPLVIGGIALFTIGTGFSVIGVGQFTIMVLIALLGFGLNYLGSLFGARRFGGSPLALLGAFIGLIPGILFLGPFGLIVGPMAGAAIAELLQGRATDQALRTSVGVLIGYVFGAVVEVVLALILTGWFFVSTFGPVTGARLPGGTGPF